MINNKTAFLLKKFLTSRYEYKILIITTLIAIIYFCYGINSWKFSFVGDEWPFYTFAKEISEKNFFINPFDLKGVYLQNSVLVSYYQAIFLKLFGYSNFAWRISNIILIIPIAIFFFLLLKKSFNTSIALISTIILQSSFYLANFFKIGNIMPQALTLFIICLYITLLYGENPSRKKAIILGLLLGISFYIYIGPLFPFLVWPYLLPLLRNRNFNRKVFFQLILLMISYLIILLPIFFNVTDWGGPAGKTALHKEYEGYSQTIINIFHNFLLFYKNYDYLYNHFVAGPYLDIITRIFAFIGTCIFLLRIKKKQYLYLILTYVSTCVMIGITSPYSYAPTTRGIFFLPFGFAFAGLALYELSKKFNIKNKFLISTTLVLIFLLNLYQSQIGVFKETGYTGTALIIKSLQDAKENNSEKGITLLLSNGNMYNYQNIYIMQQAYNLQDILFEAIRTNQLQCVHFQKAKIILFENDTEAKNTIASLLCPQQYNFSIKILKPDIYL